MDETFRIVPACQSRLIDDENLPDSDNAWSTSTSFHCSFTTSGTSDNGNEITEVPNTEKHFSNHKVIKSDDWQIDFSIMNLQEYIPENIFDDELSFSITEASSITATSPASLDPTCRSLLQVESGCSIPRKKSNKKKKNTRKKSAFEAQGNQVYVSITNDDVLLGRGGYTNRHPGNIQYLKYRKMLQARYLVASKEDKMRISKDLVKMVHKSGGRFLKTNDAIVDDTANWYEVAYADARTKASQALRES